jgi:ribosomal protein S18 acetylase RimI-like enzyme
MNDIVIKQLPVFSWQEYKHIRLKGLQTDPQAFGSSYKDEVLFPDEKWKKRLEKVGQGQSWVYFAFGPEGKVVGMIGAYRNDEFVKNHKAEIWGVYVLPEARGKGIAKLLIQKIVDILSADLDINTLSLQVNTDQEVAKKLYLGSGFKLKETHKIFLGDGVEHQVSTLERDIIR